MKVCIISYGSFSTLLQRDVEAHLERGHTVDVICYGLSSNKYNRSHGRLKVHFVFNRTYNEKHPLDYVLKVGYFWIWSFFMVSIWQIRQRYDLIHIVSPPDFMVFVALIPKVLGAKIILNIHDIVPEFYMRKFRLKEDHPMIRTLKFIEKMSCKFSDYVLTVTDIWKERLVRRGVSKSKCAVMMNVPDGAIFKPIKNNESAGSEEFRLLYPGSLGEHFGVETLIRSMPVIKEKISSIRLDVYGNGLQKEFLVNLTKEVGVRDRVHFHDFIPAKELALAMQQADIGIVPTREGVFSGEALSMKSLEFLTVATPIIISRTNASEYYYDDSMVMFFEPNNHEDLARCVFELYRNPKKREQLVRNANKFTEKHNWERYKKIYHGVIDKLCSNGLRK